jgi:hypothetical protein
VNCRMTGNLIQLRYKLSWAKTRSNNGRVALFAVGYLLFLLVSTLLSAGGFGAGVAAIRSGHAERVAQILLSALFLSAVFATVIMGFGMSSAFSDTELRRYPLHARERFVARHVLGLADPYWFFILALEMGLVTALYVYGSFSWWSGAIAALLLFLCFYLLTRVLSVWIDRLMASGSGYVVMVMLLMFGGLASAVVAIFENKRAPIAKVLPVLRFTPPFGAAAAMTRRASESFYGLAIVAVWLIALLALLIALEHRPSPRTQARRDSGSLWNSGFDRLAAMFGRPMAPLVGHWLRFYWRNNRFRILFALSLPVAAFLSVGMGRPGEPGGSLFAGVLGCLALVTLIATGPIAVNQYGSTGGGLRRFYLFPIDHGASLRAGSYAALLLGTAWIPPAALLWAIFAPRPLDARVLFMPVMNAVTALFLFNGLALWTSVYAPKRENYDSILGINGRSVLGDIVRVGAVLGCMLLPSLLRTATPRAIAPEGWWLTLPAGGFALVFYLVSLRVITYVLPGRREVLLARVEGRA